jgi:hypothetical protein
MAIFNACFRGWAPVHLALSPVKISVRKKKIEGHVLYIRNIIADGTVVRGCNLFDQVKAMS